MKTKTLGDTFKRRIWITYKGKGNGYTIDFTDWTKRQGGNVERVSLRTAFFLIRRFLSGSEYLFDFQTGIHII